MATALPDTVKKLLNGQAFASVATIQPDGSPQLSIVWAKRDGDDVLFSTVAGRRKHENLERDPRLSLLLKDEADPYVYAEIRGTATMTTEGGRELIDELSRKYMGKDYAYDTPDTVRVVVRVTPRKVVGNI
ncbi:PPOX class F420-dependent oxidoreductase [Wenjunlia tyrosinilytica]|uniref:PPOX class F420-dependent enzyme n=1 Tax=Wenjunlia tyrosinilytica TaxID=1544741 RepID=A0A917ZPL9_9ACTN|nr:PPOX class F420-dependent oxidoreductase [Wenjunlia tyrosinilytica]GGO87173.1 PPOX class F420-dependent enzyme [Wenjunlia tyrosinilytica]